LLVYGTGTVPLLLASALAPSYRARLARKRAEQEALKANLLEKRVAARLQPINQHVHREFQAVSELQRDADAVREACLGLGAGILMFRANSSSPQRIG
jgi:hypothetical protein